MNKLLNIIFLIKLHRIKQKIYAIVMKFKKKELSIMLVSD